MWRKPLRLLSILFMAACACIDGLFAEIVVAGEFRGCIFHIDAEGRWIHGQRATNADYFVVFGLVLVQAGLWWAFIRLKKPAEEAKLRLQ